MTALVDAATWLQRQGRASAARAEHMYAHMERVFRMYGLPYGVRGGEVEWVGDDVTRRQVLAPGLAALEDPRVSGARTEFRLAQAALRGGTPDKLRDATHEAGNAVEAVLHALIAHHGITPPRAKTAAALFNAVRDAGVVPAALEHTALATAQLRNAQGGHTQGAETADADRRLAEAAVSSAAVAIAALVPYLP